MTGSVIFVKECLWLGKGFLALPRKVSFAVSVSQGAARLVFLAAAQEGMIRSLGPPCKDYFRKNENFFLTRSDAPPLRRFGTQAGAFTAFYSRKATPLYIKIRAASFH